MMENYKSPNNQYTEEDAISYYVEMKKQLDMEHNNFEYIMSHMPPAYAQVDAYIKDYIKNLSRSELLSRANGLIESQNLKTNDFFIEQMSEKNIGNLSHFRSQWSPMIWQAHENNNSQKIKIGDKIVDAHDLDFSIAQSLEMQDAHRDPLTEYYDWIKIQNKIESNINTNGTTIDEISERNHFIDFMEMRETEIKRIALLYSAAALNSNSKLQPLAQEKLKFTIFKLSELRRLRDRMKSTKSIPTKRKIPQSVVERIQKIKNKNYSDYEYYTDPLKLEEDENKQQLEINSLGEHRLNGIFMPHQIVNRPVETLTNTKPVSKNIEEAQEKINILKSNYHNTIDILQAMRNGMSKEEYLRSKQNNSQTQNNREIRPIRGFDLNRFHQALRELNA